MKKSYDNSDEIREIFSTFLTSKIVEIKLLTNGNVNDTYRISAECEVGMQSAENEEAKESPKQSYILQKMNSYAYSTPVQVMENASLISEHLSHERFPFKTPNYYKDKFGEKVTRMLKEKNDDNDVVSIDYWRLCDFIDSTTYNKTTDIAIVKATGTAFGYFEYALRDFDASKLNIVIPDFHDTVKRYDRLMEAYERWQGTIPEIQKLISYLTSVRAYACWLTDLQRAGKLPLRVVHNDTKINNVLFERTPYTGNESRRNNSSTLQSIEEANGDVVPVSPYVDTTDRDSRHPNQDIKVLNRDTRHHPHPIAIIDLDTCMPGLVAHDFGDGIRYAAGIESDGRMTFNMDNFKAFCEGFIPEVAGYLTQEEKDTLYLAPFSMTIELAVRYLTDFFEGNKYFHIDYPLQNLDKARKQIELARQMYEKEENIREFVSEVLNKATCYVTK